MNFINAFTTVPLSTLARGRLFTGCLPHQTGTMDTVQGKAIFPHGKLYPDQKTYLERLQDDGFHVALVDKWHLGERTMLDRGINDVTLWDGGETPLTAAADVTFGEPRKSPLLWHDHRR